MPNSKATELQITFLTGSKKLYVVKNLRNELQSVAAYKSVESGPRAHSAKYRPDKVSNQAIQK